MVEKLRGYSSDFKEALLKYGNRFFQMQIFSK